MTPHRSASARTPTTSGIELTPRQIGAWRRRLGERLSVIRDLPWRETRDPWSILVSEVMLQQTQVRRVIPAYERFLAAFPDPATCAEAGPGAVIQHWEGLGYHRRAVALHGAAALIVAEFDGAVPENLADLKRLPGVGDYTARAVMAFAFELDLAVVDTNVARIVARAVVGRSLGAKDVQSLADALVTPGRGWEHNQAMLDFGAMTCASVPRCKGCPLRRSCSWASSGFALPDPAAATAGTARPQARFEGSDRQARGRVLAQARRGPLGVRAQRALAEGLGDERCDRAIRGLLSDGLLRQNGRELALIS